MEAFKNVTAFGARTNPKGGDNCGPRVSAAGSGWCWKVKVMPSIVLMQAIHLKQPLMCAAAS